MNPLLTVDEVRQRLCLSGASAVYRLIESGELAYVNVAMASDSKKPRIRVRAEDVDAFIQRRRVRAKNEAAAVEPSQPSVPVRMQGRRGRAASLLTLPGADRYSRRARPRPATSGSSSPVRDESESVE